MAQVSMQQYFEDEWKKLSLVLAQFLQEGAERPTAALWSNTAAHVYDFVNKLTNYDNRADSTNATPRLARELYIKLFNIFKDYAYQISKQIEKKVGDDLFWSYLKNYEKYTFRSQTVINMCKYFNKSWILRNLHEVLPNNAKVVELEKITALVWKQGCYTPLRTQLLTTLNNLVNRSRHGEAVDLELLRLMIRSFVQFSTDEPDFYKREYEKAFLEETKAFYSAESSEYLREGSVQAFLERAEARIKEEEIDRRGVFYLDESLPEVSQIMKDVWIANNTEFMMSVFNDVLKDKSKDETRRIYFLLSRDQPSLKKLVAGFYDYITQTLRRDLFDPQLNLDGKTSFIEAPKFVKNVIVAHEQYLRIVSDCFSNHVLFLEAVRKAFISLMDSPSVQKGNTLYRTFTFFIDALMKKKIPYSDEEVKQVIENVVTLCCYFTDIDEFLGQMKRSFFKRLLSPERDFENDLETQLLNTLKAKKGEAHTRHLQSMLLDAKGATAEQLLNAFITHNGGNNVIGKVKFTAVALNESVWKLTKSDKTYPPRAPEEFICLLKRFEQFFDDHTNKSKLIKWLCNHGRVEMQVNLPIKKGPSSFTAVISPLQSCILLLFNRKNTWTIGELGSTLWPDLRFTEVETVLIGALEPLLGHHKGSPASLLKLTSRKETEKTAPSPSEPISVVTEIIKCKLDKKRRALFPYQSLSQQLTEANQVTDSVIQERSFLVDCVMVKVMKTNKKMNWNNLQSSVVTELRSFFVPPPQLLKKKLEDLIDREFIERDQSDFNILIYKS